MARPWVTQRTTHARWCRHPSFINYVAAMNQQLTLPHFDMTVSIEVYFGLTEWASGPPPMIGWWKCRNVGVVIESRRWWDGECWSVAVYEDSPDDEVEEARQSRSRHSAESVRWCGLKQRHPDRYPYRLFMKGPKHEQPQSSAGLVRRAWPVESAAA